MASRPRGTARTHTHQRRSAAGLMNFSAVILAGGQSRRMGQDKAWLEVGGQPLITRALTVLRAAGIQEIFVSGRAGVDYSALRCPVLLDLHPLRPARRYPACPSGGICSDGAGPGGGPPTYDLWLPAHTC